MGMVSLIIQMPTQPITGSQCGLPCEPTPLESVTSCNWLRLGAGNHPKVYKEDGCVISVRSDLASMTFWMAFAISGFLRFSKPICPAIFGVYPSVKIIFFALLYFP